jgi:uncharacterized protein (TIGR02466 family)
MIQGLFSVPIKVGTIVPSEYDEAETDQLLTGMFLDSKLGDFTGESGLSTAPKVMNLHEKKELKWLTSKLRMEVADFWVNVLSYRRVSYIEPTHSWANKHFAMDTTAEHSHRDGWYGNSEISVVYYFRKHRAASNIIFCDPLDYIKRMTPYVPMAGIDTMGTEVPARQYDYIIFPSWLRHRVGPSDNISPRIALSFNYHGYD